MLLLTTGVIYEEYRSDWSHQFSAVATTKWCGLRDYIYASWCAITLLVIPDSQAVATL